MSSARYAVYYVPPADSALAEFGRSWLGVDIDTGERVKPGDFQGVTKQSLEALTERPRYYGFHGTLAPPFELESYSSVDGLLKSLHLYAKGVTPPDIPPLEMAVIGKFIALTPTSSSLTLESLAGGLVRSLDAFRRRKSAAELAQYRQSKLTVHQEQMLEHWGYPYVLEEFRFHMTLTDRIHDDAERSAVSDILTEVCADFLGKPIPVTEIALCLQPEVDTCMRVIERIPLGGS